MHRRGNILTDNWMGILIGIIVVVIVIFIFRSKAEAAQTTISDISPTSLEYQVRLCATKSAQSTGVSDSDGDGYIDACDTCWGGDDRKQSDQDWVADDCDQDDLKAAKSANEACCGSTLSDKTCPALSSTSPFRCEKK